MHYSDLLRSREVDFLIGRNMICGETYQLSFLRFQQITEVYGDNLLKKIADNCVMWFAKLPAKLTRRVVLQTTLTISNMPGPTEPVMFSGNPIVQMFPTVTGVPQVNVQAIVPRSFWLGVAQKFYFDIANFESDELLMYLFQRNSLDQNLT